MSNEKRVVPCVPILPKSLAREYSLNTFMNEMSELVGKAVCADSRFRPTMDKEGWCPLRADLMSTPGVKHLYMTLCAHSMELVDCGFDITVPEGYEIQVRNTKLSRFFVTNGTDYEGNPRRMRLTLINFNMAGVGVHHGDVIGEMCVRPMNNIPIMVEDEE